MGDFSTTFSRREWDMRKTAEECSELATILLQQLNKPHKDFTSEIVEELGDVIFRIDKLKLHYEAEKVTQRILHKITKEELKNERRNKTRGN
tara:strand:+ start:1415 stop:1690 length:276 start_codon:yes stop_codon:yes gene_type:complete